MKGQFFAIAMAVLALVGFAAPAAAQEGKQDFTLVNKTGYDIDKVFVSPTKTDDWEEDVLGKDVLENGDAWTIKFHRSVRTCKWDLKVVYSDDDSSAIWYGIDLCSVSKITIRYNRQSDKTSASFE
ncbi:hypothetical protein GCM10007301_43960 [Azorhizobium oxalatiphilum]|uniref:Argininosuccinate lyase n=1 Tax=Azorhizobium oxalatiphilum TaxID=980631 RepID=A0A917FG81_9HYPH|nr:argininosuccinate lyase [Azorhizobium oxalatiphilum]GGF79156.1 hypothetical protein GCM10007301_43960 [Azorhizobium oxalatiphilum]